MVKHLIEDETEAKDRLSLIFLVGNLLSMVLQFFVGFVSDKYPIHVLFSITNVTILLFLGTFYQSCESYQEMNLLFDISFVVLMASNGCTNILTLITLAKVLDV